MPSHTPEARSASKKAKAGKKMPAFLKKKKKVKGGKKKLPAFLKKKKKKTKK